MANPLRRHWARVATALVLGLLSGCRQAPALPTLGPGVPLQLGVPGDVALAPVILARPPLVALAFAAGNTHGARLYLSTSADNGAIFTAPELVDEDVWLADDAMVDLSFSTAGSWPWDGPALRLEWRRHDGSASRLAHPWRWRPFLGVPEPRASDDEPPVASCSSNGDVILVAGFSGRGPVSANHGLADQACVPTNRPVAVADARRWVHAAWAGGADDDARRVLYAASFDREWFGGAQALNDVGQHPSHVRLAIDPNDTVVATWEGTASGTRHVFLRQLIPAHHGPATLLPLTRLSDDAGGVEPSLASIDGGVIVAWRVPSTGGVVVRRVGLDAVCAATPTAASTQAVNGGVRP